MPQARRRPVPCGHAPPFGGSGGRAPLREDGRGHSPSRGVATSLKNRQFFPAVRRAELCAIPSRLYGSAQVQKRPPRPCRRQEGGSPGVQPPSRPCGTQEGGSPGVQPPPALAAGKRAARPGCNPPALAVGKKAARPGCNPLPPLRHARRRLVRGATPSRPCRRQEGGLPGVQPPPLPQARRRLVPPGHGP